MSNDSPKVLLIDDDKDLLQLIAMRLTAAGYAVTAVESGEAALAALSVSRPQVVVTDLRMQGMDGMALFDAIHRDSPSLPVVILTAFSQRELIERARDAGAMAYLVKPFTKADLLPAIELAVARYAETTALRKEVADISQRLEARKLIDRAKGLLMTHQKMTEPEAFRWIQRTAMDRRTSMQAVANAVLEGLSAKS